MSVTKESIKDYVIESLTLFDVERESIVEDASLESLGVDSLDLTELGQAVRKKFRIKVQPRDFQDVRTVGDALRVFYDKSAAA